MSFRKSQGEAGHGQDDELQHQVVQAGRAAVPEGELEQVPGQHGAGEADVRGDAVPEHGGATLAENFVVACSRRRRRTRRRETWTTC